MTKKCKPLHHYIHATAIDAHPLLWKNAGGGNLMHTKIDMMIPAREAGKVICLDMGIILVAT